MWAALCLLVNMLYPSVSNAMSLIFFLNLPLVLYFGYMKLEQRKIYLRDSCEVWTMNSELEVERMQLDFINH